MQIQGKVVVVTGGASGIGEALCRRFALEGARVAVADVNAQGAARVAGEVKGLPIKCDVSKEDEIIALVNRTQSELGPIDIFCGNAGIIEIGAVEASNAAWQRIWEINVMAHVYAARAVFPGMIARGGGYFLITASAAGLLSQIGSAPYSVTKHAAVGLAENLAITYGDQGIKISVICPQAVRTRMTGLTGNGGVAAVDGLIEAEKVAEDVLQGIAAEKFLILPHPEVQTYMERKVTDYDRWLAGMRRLQARFLQGRDLK